jgi:hypothetical protein
VSCESGNVVNIGILKRLLQNILSIAIIQIVANAQTFLQFKTRALLVFDATLLHAMRIRSLRCCSLKEKAKAITVAGRGDPSGCERSRLSHFLYSRLTDVCEVLSLKRRPPFTPRKIPVTHFC